MSKRHIRNWILGIIGLLIIIAAISFSVLRVAIKTVPDYRQALQDAVSSRMGLHLQVGRLDAEIYWFVPRLNLYDVYVYDAAGKEKLLYLQEVDVTLNWLKTLQTLSPVIGEVILVGLDLKLGLDKKSQLVVQDYVLTGNLSKSLKSVEKNEPVSFEISDSLKNNINNLNFRIVDSRLRFFDQNNKKHNKVFRNFNLRLQNDGDEHVFEVMADLPEKFGRFFHFIINARGDLFEYNKLQGELYLAVENIHAAPWLNEFWEYLPLPASGNINAQVWLDWTEQGISEIQSKLNLTDVNLNYLDKSVRTWQLEQLDAMLQWVKSDTGWQLDIRDMEIIQQENDWPYPSAATLEMDNKDGMLKLQADFLRLEGLVYLAAMGQSVYEFEVPWLGVLQQVHPQGDLKNLDISLPINNPKGIKVNTQFSRIAFSLPDMEPAEIKNLRGSVSYFDAKTWLSLDAENVQLQFDKLFRNSLDIDRLKAVLDISYIKNRLKIHTNSAQLDTPHIKTRTRFSFDMYDDRRFLDLTSQFNDGNAKYISRYLPADIMGKNLLAWLDRSISHGNIVSGGYQFYGELKDMPFRQNQGVSLADFRVKQAHIEYMPDWPALKDIDARVRILNDSLLVMADSARILDSDISATRVAIDNFSSTALDIKGSIDSRLSDIITYIDQSGLDSLVPDYINTIQLSGKGKLDLELFIPLNSTGQVEWGGQLVTRGAKADLTSQNYLLTDVDATVRFADGYFEAPSIKARLDGRPLDISILTENKFESHIYHINLQGNLDIKSLLSPLPPARQFASGHADWDISIESPSASGDGALLNIDIVSDLQGVSLDFYGPLQKPEKDEVLPLNMNLQLSVDSRLRCQLDLAQDKSIEIRELEKQWLVAVQAPDIKGSAHFNKQQNVMLPVKVDLDYLDLNRFAGSNEKKASRDGAEKNIMPRDIPSVEFRSANLKWKNFIFNRVNINTRQSKSGMVINSFLLNASDYTVTGKGSWFSGWNNTHTTRFDADVVVRDLGRTFRQLQISDSLKGAAGNVKLHLQWGDMPHRFDWTKLTGDGRLSLSSGSLGKVKVGAGRILGLFNFETLLSLDFGNQVSNSFSFDNVNASFSFSGGNVYTDNFTIKSKVADIRMQGMLGIASGTVNQKITVRPHLGSTVSLGAAVLAGPTVGGMVYLFQKLFDTDRLSEYQYSMTGTIDKPDVKLLSVPVEEQEEDDADF